MLKDLLEYVEVDYDEWMLCGRLGIERPTSVGGMYFFAPRWAKNLIDAFGTESDGAWRRVLVGVGHAKEGALLKLVRWIVRTRAYDLVEVRAALTLGGPDAALQLAGADDAQDAAHEQTVTSH